MSKSTGKTTGKAANKTDKQAQAKGAAAEAGAVSAETRRIERLLDAGGLAPLDHVPERAGSVDPVSARCYRHPALGDRPVVRLSADSLAKGDDLELEFLGFQPPTVVGPLALQRRQALGFPGWALVHDPDHARHALDIVKEFKRFARLARSKPGHGYEGFVEIAERLGRSVAHFLPSFWEEAGRSFMALGNATYAARAFGKAREAERVHALKIDESLRRDAFLEFALAGCLSIKALSEYCKELQQSAGKQGAWETFRELCVRRTRGGMPPWANMYKELAAVAKSAGLDATEEGKRLLQEIIDAPALKQTPLAFWNSCSAQVKSLAKEEPHVAGVLLNLQPETSHWDTSAIWEWVELLDKWELLPNLWRDGVPEEAQPRGGPGAWLERLIAKGGAPRPILLKILPQLAPKLREAGAALKLYYERYSHKAFNVNVLDTLLSLQVPLIEPPADVGVNLVEWCENKLLTPCDPVHVVTDATYGPRLRDAVGALAGNPNFEATATGMSGLREARRDWLLGTIAGVTQGALPDVESHLSTLQQRARRAIFQEFPEAHERLRAIQLAPALHRTLVGGLLDELGWLALDEVVDRLNPDGKSKLKNYGAFPHVVLCDGIRAVVVGPEGVELEHELQLPQGYEVKDLCYLDQQLCVMLDKPRTYGQGKFYWSADPSQLHELGYRWGDPAAAGFTFDMPDAGTYNGNRAIRAGDSKPPDTTTPFLTDGEHFWQMDWVEGAQRLRQKDPRTAAGGRVSRPAFLEEFLAPDTELCEGNCSLLAMGAFANGSPLGCRDGVVGWRLRTGRGGRFEGEGIDGRRFEGKLGDGSAQPIGLLDMPGDERRRPLSGDQGWHTRESTWKLWDPEGKYPVGTFTGGAPRYSAGQPLRSRVLFLHAYRPRDEATSRALRALQLADAESLLEAVEADLNLNRQRPVEEQTVASITNLDLPRTEQVIGRLFPQLASKRLRRGLLSVVRAAGVEAHTLAVLIEHRDPQREEELQAKPADDASSLAAMAAFGIQTGWGANKTHLLPHLEAVGKFFAGQGIPSPPASPFDWSVLLHRLEVRAWSTYWKQPDSTAWTAFLERWSRLPLHELPGNLRVIATPSEKSGGAGFREYGGNRYVSIVSPYSRNSLRVVEYAGDKPFQPLPDLQIAEETVCQQGWSASQLREFARRVNAEPRPYPTRERIQPVVDATGLTAPEVLLLWCGCPAFDVYASNFLDKEIREGLGLKVSETNAARDSLRQLDEKLRLALCAAVLAGGPEELWDPQATGPADRLIAAWASHAPPRLQIPPDMLKPVTSVFRYGVNLGDLLNAMAAPDKSPVLRVGRKYEIRPAQYGLQLVADGSDPALDQTALSAIVTLFLHLAYELPPNDRGRPLLVAAYDALRRTCADEGLLISLASIGYDPKASERLLPLIGTPQPFTGPEAGGKTLQFVDDGLVRGVGGEHHCYLAFRPAKVATEQDWERLLHLSRAGGEHGHQSGLHAYRLISSAGAKAIRDRFAELGTSVGVEADPRNSAPELVAEVAKELDVAAESAALYLQILALPDPTTARVRAWNGWSAAELGKFAKPLVAAGRLVEAKRERAGRALFLPGGWTALKAPHLPIETWKLPLFDIARGKDGSLQFHIPLIVPLEPLPELFRRAWRRVQDGDLPQYEEV